MEVNWSVSKVHSPYRSVFAESLSTRLQGAAMRAAKEANRALVDNGPDAVIDAFSSLRSPAYAQMSVGCCYSKRIVVVTERANQPPTPAGMEEYQRFEGTSFARHEIERRELLERQLTSILSLSFSSPRWKKSFFSFRSVFQRTEGAQRQGGDGLASNEKELSHRWRRRAWQTSRTVS